VGLADHRRKSPHLWAKQKGILTQKRIKHGETCLGEPFQSAGNVCLGKAVLSRATVESR
jgi:hypothetical protein